MKGGLTNSFTTATNGKSYPIVPVPTSVVNNGIYTFRLLFQCDNNAIVQRVSSGTSHCLHIMYMYMYLLCNLFLSAARHNFTVATQHIISLPHYPISLYTSIIAFVLTQPYQENTYTLPNTDLQAPLMTSLSFARTNISMVTP